MQKSNLINIFKTFSKKELRDFKKWLQSPLHNQREDVLKLYNYLSDETNLNDDEKLEKTWVFKFIYPKEKYDDAKMRQVMYFFNVAMEKYLVYAHFAEDEIRQQAILAGIYGKRNLIKPFKKAASDFQNTKEKQFQVPDNHYLFDFFFQKELYDFTNKHERSQNTNLNEAQFALDAYYCINKLRLACAAEYFNRVFKTKYESNLIEEIITLGEKGLINVPLFQLYFLVYKLIKYPTKPEYFEALKYKLDTETGTLIHSDAREIYIWSINHCVSRINLGETNYRSELFELYKNGIESGFLIEDNLITPFTFKNVISIGIILKEFEWVEHFIKHYQQYLDESQRKGIVDFNLAMLYHAKKDYKLSQRLLISLEVDDLLINLNARFLLIKIYMEQSEFELLEPQLDSMRAYLNRKEMIGSHKNTYKNVISILKKMLKIRPNDREAKQKLKDEIKNTTPLVDKDWFLRMVDGL